MIFTTKAKIRLESLNMSRIRKRLIYRKMLTDLWDSI